jgi:hypothetical protein
MISLGRGCRLAVGVFALALLGAPAHAQSVGDPGIKIITPSKWVSAPSRAEIASVAPPGDQPAVVSFECHATPDGALDNCVSANVQGGDPALRAGQKLLPKFRVSTADAAIAQQRNAFVVLFIEWRTNNCRPPYCIGPIPPAPPKAE